MKKTIQITYNPYDSKLNFKTLNPLNKTFADISSGSNLCKYVVNNVHVMFSNCVNDIVNIINNEQNTTAEGLEIQFFGTDADFLLLKKTVSECSGNSNAGELTCHHKKRFASADLFCLLQNNRRYERDSEYQRKGGYESERKS